jgi:hypothetical protein
MVTTARPYTQVELVYRLRTFIDAASYNPPKYEMPRRINRVRAQDGILELVDSGARIGTKHVLWNIGAARRRWLLSFLSEKRPNWRPYE